ncbi:MAG TPA: glycosyltransferase [Mucilaginibacter sp.]|nr:glycosyltransferase [Mucilaginibacter sp.]
MISIIVCSINDELFDQLSLSIVETIGLPFEIIRVDNKQNTHGICEAYNQGASNAKFPYLCFVHEDVIFKSKNWGIESVSFFQDNKDAGAIGVAGSKYKSLSPSTWNQRMYNVNCVNIIQHYDKSGIGGHESINRPEDSAYNEVKVLDGVLLFTKKSIWKDNIFDSVSFPGFHGYDIDYSISVGRNHKLYVSYNLLIEHFSSGSLSKEWIDSAIQISKKWREILPIGDLSPKQIKAIEWTQKTYFILVMNIFNFTISDILKVFFGFGYLKYFSIPNHFRFILFVVKKKLKF